MKVTRYENRHGQWSAKESKFAKDKASAEALASKLNDRIEEEFGWEQLREEKWEVEKENEE